MKIDGKEIAREIFEDLKKRVGELRKKNITPHLAIILVGNDPASVAYVRQKKLKAAEIGTKTTILNYESGIKNKELLEKIEELNNDKNIHGIIVQRPLPPQINNTQVNLAVDPKKDIDAFNPKSQFAMPLAEAVLKILEKIYLIKRVTRAGEPHAGAPRLLAQWETRGAGERQDPLFLDWLKSKTIVIVGKGQTGGRPVIKLLRKMNIEPTIIDSKTKNPNNVLGNGDIVISAIGKPNSLNFKKIKKGSIILSVGMYRGENGKLHGDYKEEDIKDKTLYYSPVPGGVGPVNVAMLLENLVLAAEEMQKMQFQIH